MLPWAAYDWRFRAAKSSIAVTARGSGTKGGFLTFAALQRPATSITEADVGDREIRFARFLGRPGGEQKFASSPNRLSSIAKTAIHSSIRILYERTVCPRLNAAALNQGVVTYWGFSICR